MKRLLLITDVWKQVNGVVRTLQTTVEYLKKFNVETRVLSSDDFSGFPFPFYREIKFAYPPASRIRRSIQDFSPSYIHIATEGPVGLAVRNYCVRHNLKFTTSYTTNIAEYGWEMFCVPKSIGYTYLRWFHKPSSAIMVSRFSVRDQLLKQRFKNKFAIWSRGVNSKLFYPRERKSTWKRPIILYVGRVSREKNIETMLQMYLNGTKVVVGDGPHLPYLRENYEEPNIKFTGYLHGEDLAQMYSEADVFVFPSYTDTFGLVMLEALACGTPVATWPSYRDIMPNIPGVAFMDNSLTHSTALAIDKPNREECVKFVREYYDWEKCSRQFMRNLVNV